MIKLEIHQLSAAELEWPFREQKAYARIKGSGPYGRSYEVDPFPAYAHDVNLVEAQLLRCMEFWPSGQNLFVYILDREGAARTNATTFADEWTHTDEKECYIVFSGKRIPPHPAMTRYLTWHEYGHCVEHWIEWMLYPEEKAKGKNNLLISKYAELRGLANNHIDASGGRWHDAVTEVFACDFRWFAGAERDFWPHHGVPTPDERFGLIDWWDEMRRRYLEARK